MAHRVVRADGFTKRYFWSRHANPRSVWTLIAAYPALILGIYWRHRPLLAGTLLFVAINPLVFEPPDNDEAWATRVVLGEQVWFDRGLLSSPKDVVFVAFAAPIYPYTLRVALERRPIETVLSTAVSVLSMFVFFDRMARLYGSRPNGTPLADR
jgi:hypothetical protein